MPRRLPSCSVCWKATIFNDFHALAACTRLVTLYKRKLLLPGDVKHPVLQRLIKRIQKLIVDGQVGQRSLANVIWAFAKLFQAIPGVLVALPAWAQAMSDRASAMNAQDLANSLWAAAQLQDEQPQVLKALPALVDQFPSQASDMIPQGLSNSLLAAAKLQDAAPEVIGIVPALVEEILVKAGDMIPQHLSNILWAAAQLQDAAPEVLQVVPAVVAQIPAKVAEMNPQELFSCLFAAMRLEDAVPEVVEVVPALVKEVPGKIGSMTPQGLAKALVYFEERLPIVGLPRIAAAAAMRLKRILPEVKGKDFAFSVPVIVWACGKAEVMDMDTELLTEVAKRFASRKSITTLTLGIYVPWRALIAI